jgi:hypothetical protein
MGRFLVVKPERKGTAIGSKSENQRPSKGVPARMQRRTPGGPKLGAFVWFFTPSVGLFEKVSLASLVEDAGHKSRRNTII